MSATSASSGVPGRAAAPGFKARLTQWAMSDGFDLFTRVLRRIRPIPRAFGYTAVLRYDDVVEVFGNAAAFPVDYKAKLAVIMGPDREFFLGMDDTAAYRRDTSMLRRAMRPEDIEGLMKATEALAAAKVDAGGGRIEVVQMVRDVTLGVLCPYFGVTAPEGVDLQALATRLFQFQFTDLGNDPALRTQVEQTAPLLRDHVDTLIAARKGGNGGPDDVLGRCLEMQRQGIAGADDAGIRTALMGVVIAGPPQPPMVVPQALEQLLRRPTPLAAAQAAARAGDDAALAALVTEAMRFDPLAPGVFRRAAYDTTIAAGTARATSVRSGARIFVSFRSAMRDSAFVPHPEVFDASRSTEQYIQYGHGLHACFGVHLNRALLPLMLKPLLARSNLRRAPGRDGRLSKTGGFADRLVVLYD